LGHRPQKTSINVGARRGNVVHRQYSPSGSHRSSEPPGRGASPQRGKPSQWCSASRLQAPNSRVCWALNSTAKRICCAPRPQRSKAATPSAPAAELADLCRGGSWPSSPGTRPTHAHRHAASVQRIMPRRHGAQESAFADSKNSSPAANAACGLRRTPGCERDGPEDIRELVALSCDVSAHVRRQLRLPK